jgi:hypothetical protein
MEANSREQCTSVAFAWPAFIPLSQPLKESSLPSTVDAVPVGWQYLILELGRWPRHDQMGCNSLPCYTILFRDMNVTWTRPIQRLYLVSAALFYFK